MTPRYLTKSRFILALECPTKTYYDKKTEYANQKLEDTFLMDLAKGGFQVGELAKHYFPGGHDVKTLDYEEALRQTNDLLKLDRVTIYEAAVRFETLFIRADILIKDGSSLELIEVKAKSYNPQSDSFVTKGRAIASTWQQYLYDVAFQKYVVESAFPQYAVQAYLMMADKTASCPTDGLNQKFRIKKDENGRKSVTVSPSLCQEDLLSPILCKVNVDECCDLIYSSDIKTAGFYDFVAMMADCCINDYKVPPQPSSACGKCEFRATDQELAKGLKSGFHECWKESLGWTDEDFEEATVLDIWNYRKKDQCIKQGRIKLSDIREEDIAPKSGDRPGLSGSQRQWLQVQRAQDNDMTPWIDKENLKQEMSSWAYPLHFIDFETSTAAIPFNRGRRPYEGIAFQYSHHIVHEDGTIVHCGQYLNAEPGIFPNYDFVRNLKRELEKDQGSIFRYSHHENTYLNIIYRQLMEDPNHVPDRDELCSFIRSITQDRDEGEGPRNMIDMCELVKAYYYDPFMKGSNSIKAVLPAILNSSKYLQDKYSQPIYGAQGGIVSLNYMDWKWIEFENGMVKDPYLLLPRMFEDVADINFELLSDDDQLREGGAASAAYARMQFEDMSDYERSELRQALLKYCELDTLAMVMIYEGWKDLLGD
jgi:hypothetical protein